MGILLAVNRPSWDEYFMQIAHMVATRATCPRRSVGAVIVLDKSMFYARYGVQEYYIYDPDRGELYGFVRDESGHLRRVSEMQGWVSPLLGVRFALEGGELVVVRPDGARFVGYEELAAALEQAQARAEQERLLREQEQQRAERLAQKLRELGVEPD